MDEITEAARKKRKFLYTIEVLFHEGLDVKRYQLRNRTSAEIQELRETFFKAGIAIQIDPGRWQIVPPFEIKRVTMELQKQYFDY